MADSPKEKPKSNLLLIIGVFVLLVIILILIWWFFTPSTVTPNTSVASRVIGSLSKVPSQKDPKHTKAVKAVASAKLHRALSAVTADTFLAMTNQPLTPQQVLSAYNSGTFKVDGKGKKIAIVVAFNYPGIQKDMDDFCRVFKLPQKKLIIHNVSPSTPTNDGWALEANLDTQYAYLMAPNSEIHVVFSASDSITDMRQAVILAKSLNVDVISMSWGIDESIVAQYNLQYYFEDLFTSQTGSPFYLAASGDSLNVSYPSSSNNVIAVGGTTLNMNGMRKNGEFPWADPNGSGAGQGLSVIFNKPSYQSLTNTSTNRMTPDLSLIASTPGEYGVMVVHRGSIYGVSGTSLSTPLLAGLIASGLSYRKTRLSQAGMLNNIYSFVPRNTPFTLLGGIGGIDEDFIRYLSNA